MKDFEILKRKLKRKLPSRSGDDSPDGSSTGFKLSRFATKLLAFLGVFAFIWFFRPWFHGFFYGIRYSPFAAIAFGIPIILALILYFTPPIDEQKTDSIGKKMMIFGAFFVFLFITGIIVGGIASHYEERTMANEVMDNVEIADEPREMNEENPRIAPRAVRDTQTDGTLSYPQHTLGESDITRNQDGDLVWSYPIMPDQIRNQFSDNQIGLVHADMADMDGGNFETYDEHEFEYGQNMRLWDNVEWQMKKDGGFWSKYEDDPYEFVYDGDAYMVFPKTGHEWHMTPVPHTTPTWDGVALVHQDGTIEHLSAEEAQERPELDGQRLYPLHNSKEYAESLEYRGGIWNQMPIVGSYEGVVEPAEMPSGVGNEQPFVVDMHDETMNYMYAMEPPGGGAGLSEIWYFDAETGEPTMYDTGSDNVFGPDRAVGIARGTDTRTEWGEDGEAMAVEPILTTVDGDLYWHIKVTTSDQTDVVRNIFVNAEGGASDDDVEDAVEASVVMESSEEVTAFMAGDIDEDELQTGNETEDIEVEEPEDDDSDGIAYYIVIKDEDGNEIDRIPVEEGQETVIDAESTGDVEAEP